MDPIDESTDYAERPVCDFREISVFCTTHKVASQYLRNSTFPLCDPPPTSVSRISQISAREPFHISNLVVSRLLRNSFSKVSVPAIVYSKCSGQLIFEKFCPPSLRTTPYVCTLFTLCVCVCVCAWVCVCTQFTV